MKTIKTTFNCDVCGKQINSDKDVYPHGWYKLSELNLEIPDKNKSIIIDNQDFCGRNCFLKKILNEVGSEEQQRSSFEPQNQIRQATITPFSQNEFEQPPCYDDVRGNNFFDDKSIPETKKKGFFGFGKKKLRLS